MPTSAARFQGLMRAFLDNPSSMYPLEALALMRGTPEPLRDQFKEHPLYDEWCEFTISKVEEYLRSRRGFLYVAETPQYPETFKVGFTRKSVSVRLAVLSGTSVIYPFREAFSMNSHDCIYVERLFHKHLRTSGLAQAKEFYRIDLTYAVATLNLINSVDAEILHKNGVKLPPPL